MTNWNDPTEIAKNAVSYAKIIHTFFGIYIWELVSSLDIDWTYVRHIKRARVSMTFRFLNRYCLLLALIGLALALDVTRESDCQPLFTMSMLCSNIALELASICLTLRITSARVSGRWALRWVAIVIILVFGLLIQAGLLFYAPVKVTWIPGLGCVITTTGLSSNVLTIRYTFVTAYSFILFALAGWKYASLDDAMIRSDRLSAKELCYFGVGFIASAVNTTFIWTNLNSMMQIIAMTPFITIISITSCRVIVLWNHSLRTVAPPQAARQSPSFDRHPMMSFIGWGLPLFGRPAHETLNIPGFRRLSSTAGSDAGSYSGPVDSMQAATSAPSSIILPSFIAPSPTYDPRLSQGSSSRLASGSDSSIQGDCYDPAAKLIATEPRIV